MSALGMTRDEIELDDDQNMEIARSYDSGSLEFEGNSTDGDHELRDIMNGPGDWTHDDNYDNRDEGEGLTEWDETISDEMIQSNEHQYTRDEMYGQYQKNFSPDEDPPESQIRMERNHRTKRDEFRRKEKKEKKEKKLQSGNVDMNDDLSLGFGNKEKIKTINKDDLYIKELKKLSSSEHTDAHDPQESTSDHRWKTALPEAVPDQEHASHRVHKNISRIPEPKIHVGQGYYSRGSRPEEEPEEEHIENVDTSFSHKKDEHIRTYFDKIGMDKDEEETQEESRESREPSTTGPSGTSSTQDDESMVEDERRPRAQVNPDEIARVHESLRAAAASTLQQRVVRVQKAAPDRQVKAQELGDVTKNQIRNREQKVASSKPLETSSNQQVFHSAPTENRTSPPEQYSKPIDTIVTEQTIPTLTIPKAETTYVKDVSEQQEPENTTPEVTEPTSPAEQLPPPETVNSNNQVSPIRPEGEIKNKPPSREVEKTNARLSRNYADASQTMKHHLGICLKFVSLMYQHYEDRMKQDNVKDQEKDERYLQVVMLNSSLLKALHVCESFQAHCVREFPEVSFDFDDPLTSFDGTLTTIYEGEDMSTINRLNIPAEEPVSAEAHRGLQAECVCLRDNITELENQMRGSEEKIRGLNKSLEDTCTREKELTEKVRFLMHKEPKFEEVEVAPGIVVNCEMAKDSLNISNKDLDRFRSVIQNLTDEVKRTREERDISRMSAEKIMVEMDETMRMIASSSHSIRQNNRRNPGTSGQNSGVQTPLTLKEKVIRLIRDRERYLLEIRKLRSEKKSNGSNEMLKQQHKDMQLRFNTMSKKYEELMMKLKKVNMISRNSAVEHPAPRIAPAPIPVHRGAGGPPIAMKRRHSMHTTEDDTRSRSSSNLRSQSASNQIRNTGRRGQSEHPIDRSTTQLSARTNSENEDNESFGDDLDDSYYEAVQSPLRQMKPQPRGKVINTLAPSPSAPNLTKSQSSVNSRYRSSSCGRREDFSEKVSTSARTRIYTKAPLPRAVFRPNERTASSGAGPPVSNAPGSNYVATQSNANFTQSGHPVPSTSSVNNVSHRTAATSSMPSFHSARATTTAVNTTSPVSPQGANGNTNNVQNTQTVTALGVQPNSPTLYMQTSPQMLSRPAGVSVQAAVRGFSPTIQPQPRLNTKPMVSSWPTRQSWPQH